MKELIHTEFFEFDQKKFKINVYRTQGGPSPFKDSFDSEVLLNEKPFSIVTHGIVYDVVVTLYKIKPEEIIKYAIKYAVEETKKEIQNK